MNRKPALTYCDHGVSLDEPCEECRNPNVVDPRRSSHFTNESIDRAGFPAHISRDGKAYYKETTETKSTSPEHRYNYDQREDGLYVCRGDHPKSSSCQWEWELVPSTSPVAICKNCKETIVMSADVWIHPKTKRIDVGSGRQCFTFAEPADSSQSTTSSIEGVEPPERIWIDRTSLKRKNGYIYLTNPNDADYDYAPIEYVRASLDRNEMPIEESALRLFKAFHRSKKLDMAQAVACLMEIYYSHNEALISDAVIRLESLGGMSDQEWPAIIGGGE